MAEFEIINPSNGELVTSYPLMGPDEVDEAVKKAGLAWQSWSGASFETRKEILTKAAAVIAEDAERYARIVSDETGKTVMDALMADIYPVAGLLKYYAKNLKKFLKPVKGEANIFLPARKSYYTYEPKGVVGVISPWNYPLSLSAGPVITAVAAGNAVVLKPSSQTTGSGIAIKEIFEKAGLPEGVVQTITGSGSVTGQALIENEGIDMLFFTGSTGVGKMVNVTAAKRLIPTIMELGGKDVAIVTKNANLDRAAHSIAWGAFTNSGQTCIGMEIAIVHKDVYEQFLEKITKITKDLKSGDKSGEIGSMTMAAQLKIVEEQVEDAVSGGAAIITGGKRDPDKKGLFYPPTILTGTNMNMKLMTDETFGPLLPIVPYENIDEAIEIANSTEFGLSGAIFTKDMAEGRSIAKRMNTGSVNINDVLITFANHSLPFGGNKQSGVGRYHSKMGLRAFTNIKSITEFPWDLYNKEPYWYPVLKNGDLLIKEALRVLFSLDTGKRVKAALNAILIILKGRLK